MLLDTSRLIYKTLACIHKGNNGTCFEDTERAQTRKMMTIDVVRYITARIASDSISLLFSTSRGIENAMASSNIDTIIQNIAICPNIVFSLLSPRRGLLICKPDGEQTLVIDCKWNCVTYFGYIVSRFQYCCSANS